MKYVTLYIDIDCLFVNITLLVSNEENPKNSFAFEKEAMAQVSFIVVAVVSLVVAMTFYAGTAHVMFLSCSSLTSVIHNISFYSQIYS